jgi:integrase
MLVALKKRSDGRVVKNIIDPRTGKRKYFYGKTEKEVLRKIMAYEGEVERGKSFKEIAEDWWEEARPKLAIQTVRSYIVALKRAVEFFGDKSIKDVTPRDINVFLKHLSTQYAQKTIANHRLVVNLICEYAVLDGEIMYNPCASVAAPKGLGKAQRKSAAVTEEQIILQNGKEYPLPFFALMTGMRKGEILALTWGDIDFEHDLIHVTKSLAHESNTPVVKEPKTEAGRRIVPLLAPLKELLLDMKGNAKENDIIISYNGGYYTHRYFQKEYMRTQKALGITCTMHQIRHSFATMAFEAGLQPKALQEILGHRQISTTMDIYTDFRAKSIASATAILNGQAVNMRSDSSKPVDK